MHETSQKREELQHKTFVMMLWLLVIFGLPAVGAYFGGLWLDTTFKMRPLGTVICSIIALIISWTITIIIYKRFKKAFKRLDTQD